MEMRRQEYTVGDMLLIYTEDESGHMGFSLQPEGFDEPGTSLLSAQDSCVQVRLEGDDYPNGFANGHTFHGSQTAAMLRLKEQFAVRENRKITVHTLLSDGRVEADFVVWGYEDGDWIEASTAIRNLTDEPVRLELLSSFCLGGIFPSLTEKDAGAMRVCRLRSRWSAEGRMEKIPLEELQLEKSWAGYGVAAERFGQTGGMPVRKFFPVTGIEDSASGRTWCARLAVPSSWMMEVYRRTEEVVISGGLPDLDFGHWRKSLGSGESFTTPAAVLTVCRGDFDESLRRMMHHETITKEAEETGKLPVIFNEYCSTWGNPSQESVIKTLGVLKEKDIDYFVIDAGWYANEHGGWEMNMGDWIVNRRLFPNGLRVCADAIRQAGMIPGLWFELEIAGRDSLAFHKEDMLLKRDGHVITVGSRRFFDMRKEKTRSYLHERVTDALKDNGFGYLKIDYNDSLGMGCDDEDGIGEGLRKQIQCSLSFLREMKEKYPELKIEDCSSGGHRLETSFMEATDFVSFSDAHEEKEIPVIAANLHRAVQPSRSEIWAVIRAEDDDRRLRYSLCNTFLGVMCLSGDMDGLDRHQWQIIEDAIRFYRNSSGVIINGESYLHQNIGISYRILTGTQVVIRKTAADREVLVIFHRFRSDEGAAAIPVDTEYTIADSFGEEGCWELSGGMLTGKLKDDYSAAAVLLRK